MRACVYAVQHQAETIALAGNIDKASLIDKRANDHQAHAARGGLPMQLAINRCGQAAALKAFQTHITNLDCQRGVIDRATHIDAQARATLITMLDRIDAGFTKCSLEVFDSRVVESKAAGKGSNGFARDLLIAKFTRNRKLKRRMEGW